MADYSCTMCRKTTPRDMLTVKKVHFLTIGESPKTVKSRTESWLCPECLVRDPAWKLERFDAPGFGRRHVRG